VRFYLSDGYGLPENILLRLIDEKKLPLEESLQNMAIIHNSYVSVILKSDKK
jgi:hypothetical protein